MVHFPASHGWLSEGSLCEVVFCLVLVQNCLNQREENGEFIINEMGLSFKRGYSLSVEKSQNFNGNRKKTQPLQPKDLPSCCFGWGSKLGSPQPSGGPQNGPSYIAVGSLIWTQSLVLRNLVVGKYHALCKHDDLTGLSSFSYSTRN